MRDKKGLFVKSGPSNMERVKQCFIQGITDRHDIAQHLGMTVAQVRYAMNNLYTRGHIVAVAQHGAGKGKGRAYTEYELTNYSPVVSNTRPARPERRTVFSGVSSIFNLGAA